MVFLLLLGEPALPQPDSKTLNPPANCTYCHSDYKLIKGGGSERRILYIDMAEFKKSVHSKLKCVDCHTSYTHNPHTIPTSTDDPLGRKARFDPGALLSCKKCHRKSWAEYAVSIHYVEISTKGNSKSAYCTDCHGYHYVRSSKDKSSPTYRQNSPVTCAKCHKETDIYTTFSIDRTVAGYYKESFHGKRAALGETSVPVCVTCHENHNVRAKNDPLAKVNVSKVSNVCAQCHKGASVSFVYAFDHYSPTETGSVFNFVLEKVYLWAILLVLMGFLVLIILDLKKRLSEGRHH